MENFTEEELIKMMYNFYLQGINDQKQNRILGNGFSDFYWFVKSYKDSIFPEIKNGIFDFGFLNSITLRTVLSEKEE